MMKYLRMFGRFALAAIVIALLIVIAEHVTGEDVPGWTALVCGCLAAFAFWED